MTTARAITTDELYALHSSGQYSKVRALFVPQPELFHALLNGAPASNDSVTTLNYDTVTVGAYNYLLYGMTMYVYTPAGDYAGMVRIRSATASVITIGRASDIIWVDNMILSAVQDFGYWAKLPYLPDESTIWLDDNVPYGNDNVEMRPVPIMGPDRAVAYSAGGSIAFNGADSYTLDGTSISSYAWHISTGGSMLSQTSGSAASSYTIPVPAPGLYLVKLTITSSLNRVTTGYRTLYVYQESDLEDQLNLQTMGTTTTEGGWSAEIELWAGADTSLVKDRAKVFLISNDSYGGSTASYGQVAGSESTLIVGWIDGDSIVYDRETSSVKFTIQGGRFWIDKLSAPSTSLSTISYEVDATEEDTNNWLFFNNLTPDKFIHAFMLWRSTAMEIMDVYPSSVSLTLGGATAGIGTIWSQMNSTINSRLLMRMGVDRYNRFFLMQDPQIIPLVDRESIPVVQALTGDDFGNSVDIKRIVTTSVGMTIVSALMGTQTDTIAMSRAPGSLVYKRYGESKTYDRCVVNTQAEANALSGMLLAKNNNEYPEIGISMAENNRFFDIAPVMYGTMTVTSAQNARGISFTNKRVIPKRIDYRIDPEKGYFTADITFEAETSGSPGVTVDMPVLPIYNYPPQPDFPVIDVPLVPIPSYEAPGFTIPPHYINPYYNNPNIHNPNAVIPDYAPPYVPRRPVIISSGSVPCGNLELANGGYDTKIPAGAYFSTDEGRVLARFQCRLRSNSHVNKSRYELDAVFQKLNASGTYSNTTEDSWYTIYGCNASGSRVATFTHDAVSGSTSGSAASVRTGVWSGASTDIEYVELALTKETPFRPTSVTYPPFTGGGGFQNSPRIMGNITWGYSQNGIWIRHMNSGDDISRYLFLTNPMWLMTYKVSGSPASYYGKQFRIGFSSHKRSASFPNARQYPGEINVESENWMLYQCFIGDIYGGSGRVVGDDHRGSYQVIGGSVMSPNIYENNVINYETILNVSHRMAIKDGLYWVYEDDLLITVTSSPTYKMIVNSLKLFNICNAPRQVIGTAAVEVGA